jgi:hypothetical protein
MKKLFFSIAAILIIVVSNAQWSYVDVNSQPVRKNLGPIASDNNGNTIITGQWENTITFGGLTLTNPTPHYGSYNSVFVAKMSATETFSWVNAIYPQEIPTGVSIAHIYGANTDAAGNIYLTGSFSGKIKFGSTIISSTKNGNAFTYDIFITKISPSGAFLWANKEGTSYSCNSEYGRSVCADASGNIYLTGKMTQKVLKNVDTCSPCVPALYVAKYNTNGVKQWEKLFYNSQAAGSVCGESTHGTDIRSNGTDVYVKGDIYGSVNFGTVTLNTGSNTISNVVLLKLNASGTTVFAKSVTGDKNIGYAVGDGLFVDINGDAYIRGIFYPGGTITFGGCSLTFSGLQGYLAKFNSAGNCIWAGTYGTSYGEVPHPDGNLAMLLRRTGSPYPVGGWYAIKELSPLDGSAIDSTEIPLADTATGSVGSYPSIAALPNGFIFTQMVYGTIHFGPLTITAAGAEDLVLIKYTTPPPPVARQGNIIPETSSNKIVLYPNPASGQITIQNNNNNLLGTVSIYDMSGKMMYKKFIGSFQTTIDVKNFSAGVYCIRSDQLQATIKFVKQ